MKIKPLHLALLLVVAVAIGVVVSTSGDASTYVCFKDAARMAQDGDDDKVHVVGTLQKGAAGEIVGMQYDPVKDPNYFVFQLVDEKNETRQVVCYEPKPADFERSEKIVVVGGMHQNQFVADKILMKCPSKYQEEVNL